MSIQDPELPQSIKIAALDMFDMWPDQTNDSYYSWIYMDDDDNKVGREYLG